ncbi:ADP-ribose glycohydrolase MACROD1 isoform X4 [Nelusetta ayraudi]|uniref:ADP-ribose glycohydrolase MACROD1 isoform X4 n=1 Tax=Nelusetta ayraudi TaxID=303726 RepID=UPI003F6FB9D9
MALQMSSLLPHCKVPLSRVRANFQGVGVRFKHVLSPGIPHCARKPAVGLSRTRSPVTAEKFSTTARSEALWRSAAGSTCSASSRKTSGLLGRVVLGVAAGVSSVAVVQALHTGSLSAMARRVNLESAEGNWKETKDFLLSQPVHDRRQFYRTASYVPLDDIPVWTPLAAVSDKTICQRNEKLDQKISLYSGDLTKLEIDAIVNAGTRVSVMEPRAALLPNLSQDRRKDGAGSGHNQLTRTLSEDRGFTDSSRASPSTCPPLPGGRGNTRPGRCLACKVKREPCVGTSRELVVVLPWGTEATAGPLPIPSSPSPYLSAGFIPIPVLGTAGGPSHCSMREVRSLRIWPLTDSGP